MPRLTLQRKFFMALALLLVLLMGLFVGLSRLGLQRGIGPYVAEIELSRLDWLVANLARAYAREGNWAFVRQDPASWHRLQMPDGGARFPPAAERPPLPRGAPPPHHGGGPAEPQLDLLPQHLAPPPPPDQPGDPRASPDSLYRRLSLWDADGRQPLAGLAAPAEGILRKPIQVDGRTVGFLGLAPLQGLGSSADRAFVAQQSAFVIYVGLAGLLLALLMSAWLARRWVRPVERLVGAARSVAEGRRDVVVPVQGSDEFADLTRTFNDMAQRLARTEQSRQQWLADVAHELRTPVAALRAEIEAVQDGVRSFDPATARRLHGQVMRLGRLVEDLRLVTQDTDAPGALALLPTRPLGILVEVIESMQPRLQQRGLRLEGLAALQALAATQAPVIQADAARLAQVFVNLLENSLRYTDAGGLVRLEASSAAPGAFGLVVEDSAPAPRAQDYARLFERFFRGEASRDRASGGAGLGLSICQSIVQAHGGQISAAPSPLGGLRITLTLPAAP
ncbi:MAG: HAMP domain-containing protein [Ramlibacter sp.]|nr:HAMP domain-containing protein [Ramlibacter sp.]